MRKKFKANGRLEPKKDQASVKDMKKVVECQHCGHQNEVSEPIRFGGVYVCANCGKEATGIN